MWNVRGATKLTCERLSEAHAIELAKRGDAEAFEVLYQRHRRRVYSLCLRMTTNVALAEDLTQDSFMQVFRKIGTFRGEAAFSTWLHRMVVNIVLMHLRKKGLALVPLGDTFESEEAPIHELGGEDGRLTRSVDRLDLTRAIGELPQGYRMIFLLHDVEGYEHNEIAAIVGCSIGNSKSQLHKARMRLRDLLKPSRAEEVTKPRRVSCSLERHRESASTLRTHSDAMAMMTVKGVEEVRRLAGEI